jgi:glycosyltransferase involved in cell wall biosynthesis
MPSKIKVLIVHNIMAPYRFPLFKELANHREIDLTVWFMSRSAKNRMWSVFESNLGFKYNVLPGVALNYLSRDLFTYTLNYTFPWRYATHKFDVMISAGWLDFSCQAGSFISKLLSRRFVLWSESTSYEPSLKRSLAAPLVKKIVGSADACIAVGTRSKDYLLSLGARKQNVFTAYSTVDVDLFRQVSAAARPRRLQHRLALGIDRQRVILYCGQFIERKGLRHLVNGFALIKREYDDVALVLIGYGPERSELLAQIRELGLQDVHVIEHVEVADMPKMYALADIFVLPSIEETWGLVVNEAMACGLPIICSDRVGSSVDLVRNGENGYIVPAGDPASIAERALILLNNIDLLTRFSSCSAKRIMDFTPQRAADVFVDAVQLAMARPRGVARC